jgi:hypothetical protein
MSILVFIGCTNERQDDLKKSGDERTINIQQAWQGDFPVEKLSLLPENQRNNRLGYIGDQDTFAAIWSHFKPNQSNPLIDFKENLILFARNVQFYNRISITTVQLKDGVAEIIARETMSALPIKDNVAFSAVVVTREGINEIQIGDERLSID